MAEFNYEIWADTYPSFFESTLGSHAEDMKSYAWGWDGGCGYPLPNGRYLRYPAWSKKGNVRDMNPKLRGVRSRIPVNTFAEWGPSEWRDWPLGSFEVGVDNLSVQNAEE
jgi:hypothetical protein